MENKTPLQKAFKDYLNNRYYLWQLVALSILIVFFFQINQFETTFDIVLILIPILGALLTPFIFIFIWARQYKKGTRK